MRAMRAALLHLDTALIGQDALAGRVAAAGGRAVEARDLGPSLRLWSRPRAIEALRDRLREALPAAEGAALVIAGSGDFHHVSPLLLERALEASGAPAVTLLHFDNHPDWVQFANGVHCGSWVGWAARTPAVAKVVTVGVCSRDIRRPSPRRADLELVSGGRLELYAYRDPDGAGAVRLCGREWPTIAAIGEAAFAELLAGRVETEAVYVTIDKDVLRADDAATNWDQGQTSLEFLKRLIAAVLAGHRLIGADVVGDWSPAVYGGGPLATLMKQGEALLDQPWSRPAPAARAANENVNLELLQLLAGQSR
ncbi:MAG: arginase family protein [Proteobacteria bacterium]|nr:arginase family protein [Pseudomonadota bacterium]